MAKEWRVCLVGESSLIVFRFEWQQCRQAATGFQRGAGRNLIGSFGKGGDHLYVARGSELSSALKQFDDVEYSLHQDAIRHLQPMAPVARNANAQVRRLVGWRASRDRFRS